MCETNMFSILCLCAAPTVERVASGFNITTILPPSIASYEQGSQVSPRNGWKFDPVGYCDVNATSFLDAERAPECDGWARRGPDGGYTLAAFEARYRFGDKGLMEHCCAPRNDVRSKLCPAVCHTLVPCCPNVGRGRPAILDLLERASTTPPPADHVVSNIVTDEEDGSADVWGAIRDGMLLSVVVMCALAAAYKWGCRLHKRAAVSASGIETSDYEAGYEVPKEEIVLNFPKPPTMSDL